MIVSGDNLTTPYCAATLPCKMQIFTTQTDKQWAGGHGI